MKYVIVNLGTAELPYECPILFPDAVTHSEVVGSMKAVSAGFVTLKKGVKVSGRSASLNLRPRRKDVSLIAACLIGEEALLPFISLKPDPRPPTADL